MKEKKFEYYTANHRLDQFQLNRLGKNGWELVSHSVVYYDGSISQYYVFKREIID